MVLLLVTMVPVLKMVVMVVVVMVHVRVLADAIVY